MFTKYYLTRRIYEDKPCVEHSVRRYLSLKSSNTVGAHLGMLSPMNRSGQWLRCLGLVGLLAIGSIAEAISGIWERDIKIPPGGRKNIYRLPRAEWEQSVARGRDLVFQHPVSVTGALIPLKPFENFFSRSDHDYWRIFLSKLIRMTIPYKKKEDVFRWLGLHDFPADGSIPRPSGARPGDPMGFTIIRQGGTDGFTFSCATCHVGQLFGRPIIGLTNRFQRANDFFASGKAGVERLSPEMFDWSSGATADEVKMYKRTQTSMKFVELQESSVLGMDGSLAMVALSLSHRAPDSWATRSESHAKNPFADRLRNTKAESKPAPWWTVKYKNRWLLDGSIVSGNPIVTNFLWNEIGRGTDLVELDQWMNQNEPVIQALTSYVFQVSAPRFEEFFLESEFPIERAVRGQRLFEKNCASCHGTYEKNWNATSGALRTLKVIPPALTRAVDVGTDAFRSQGMTSLASRLNSLEISKNNGIFIEPVRGYVPPILEGIWARWPYFHNNSAPNLCAVLTRSVDRPKNFWMGEANSKDRDFDKSCNGYPVGRFTPASWKTDQRYFFDSQKQGLSNSGHDEGIFLSQGKEIFLDSEKQDLIHFLQTL